MNHVCNLPDDIGLDHIAYEFVERDMPLPAQDLLRLRGVAEQLLDFCWSEVLCCNRSRMSDWVASHVQAGKISRSIRTMTLPV